MEQEFMEYWEVLYKAHYLTDKTASTVRHLNCNSGQLGSIQKCTQSNNVVLEIDTSSTNLKNIFKIGYIMAMPQCQTSDEN